jgi:tartrate dehydrogenase/decarboxylase / D-malate dehydrogenase
MGGRLGPEPACQCTVGSCAARHHAHPNLNPKRRFPSRFEPLHGSAFDIAGKGTVNLAATFSTTAIMLEHSGECDAAARLMVAVEHVTASPALHTPELGGRVTTAQVMEAVRDALRSAKV